MVTLTHSSLRTSDRIEPLHNYEHKKLIETITKLDEAPADPHGFSKWIQADAHLAFMRENAQSDELL